MSQLRFHNWRRPLQSFAENLRLLGVVHNGVYAGFDIATPQGGTTMRLTHTLTGMLHTPQGGSSLANPRGVLVSNQGAVIQEDDFVDVAVNTNAGNSSERRDVLVIQHSFLDSPGGASATYSIIQGATGVATEPSLTNPALQTKVGVFRIPANATDHTNTFWERAEVKKLGGQYAFMKDSEVDLPQLGSYFSDFNSVIKSGMYYMPSASTNRPTTASGQWFVLVMKRGSEIVQLALSKATGKVYSRAFSSSAWSPWVNLNNVDIEASVTNLETIVGNTMYTQNNYVTDSQSLTASIDALDIALKTVALSLTSLTTTVNNLSTNIGNLIYTANNIVVDGETVTASIDKLDQQLNIPWITTGHTFGTDVSGDNFAYRKVNGQVQLRGWLIGSTGLPQDTMILTLPAGYRPTHDRILVGYTYSLFGGGVNSFTIHTDGTLKFDSAAFQSATGIVLSLDGLQFPF